MKKILFLLLLTVSSYGQTYQNPTFGTVTTKTSPTVTDDPYVTTTGATGTQGKIAPVNLLIPYTPVNYSVPNLTIGAHLGGIDTRLGQISSTTAGITQRVYFTADNTTVNSVVYFASSLSGKGSTASGSPPALVLADNTKAYFTKDIISIAQPSPTIGYAGTYSGNLTVSATPTPVATQQRFTVEIYRTDNLGTPIASGVSGAPTGDLGVTVLAILDSGIINLSAGSITNVSVSGILTQNITLNTGERLRYHVSAAKIGSGGGNVTFGVYYGNAYNSYYDVPVAITTDAVLNKSTATGVALTDVLNALNSNKENTENKVTDFTVVNNTLFPTTQATKNYQEGIIRTNMLSEYRFLDSGSTLSDSSGNGYDGSYIGSPTRIQGGGFVADNGKYAVSVNQAIATAQTIYMVVGIGTNLEATNTYQSLLGNSTGIANVNILQNFSNTGFAFPNANLFATGASSNGRVYTTAPANYYILAVTIYNDNVTNSKVYINGKEVVYTDRITGLATKRGGIPWIGQTNATNGYFKGDIYYMSTYSTVHTDAEVSANSNNILEYLLYRGNKPMTNIGTEYINTLTFAGDSNTYGQGATTPFRTLVTPIDTFTKYNKGWSGITAASTLFATEGFTTSLFNPKGINVVNVLLGTNDVVSATGEQSFKNVRIIASMYKSKGYKVIVNTLFDRVGFSARILTFNALMRESWSNFADALCDLGNDSRLQDSSNTTYFQVDGVHLTNAGHQVISDLLTPVINKVTNQRIIPNSTGAYDIIVQNASTKAIEKIPSTTFAPTASPTFTGTAGFYVADIDSGYIGFSTNTTGVGINRPALFRQSDKLGLKGSITNNNAWLIDTNLLTAPRNVTVPDSDGTLAVTLNGSATLDFPSTAAGSSSELTITVTGASEGDVVALGITNSAVLSNSCYTARVSAANTVTVRFNNYSGSSADPGSGTFKIKVFKN